MSVDKQNRTSNAEKGHRLKRGPFVFQNAAFRAAERSPFNGEINGVLVTNRRGDLASKFVGAIFFIARVHRVNGLSKDVRESPPR
jgi:hypothetical protein